MTFDFFKTDNFMSIIKGRPVGDIPETISGISIDSRTISANEAFFAIKGTRFDGHDFVRAAGYSGASVAVINEQKLVSFGMINVPLIVVKDVYSSMVLLARKIRKQMQGQVIAITGSAGKTSVKEILRHGLLNSGKVYAAPASFNNHIGVPLTLAKMPHDTQFGVFEIGMSGSGEIRPLSRMVSPDIALINNIGPAHLESFLNVEEIAKAKAEIFSGIVKDGTVVLNRDDYYYDLLVKLAKNEGVKKIVTFGENISSDFQLVDYAAGLEGSQFGVSIRGEKISINLNLPGRHMALNTAAALACASLLGVSAEVFASALKDIPMIKGRGKHVKLSIDGGTAILIDESYNANPVSMTASIQMLGNMPINKNGRRIAVLGDMLELGENSIKLHCDLHQVIMNSNLDKVFLVGEKMSYLRDSIDYQQLGGYALTSEKLWPMLLTELRRDDVLMLKASNKTGFGNLVVLLQKTYPEVILN